jgi:outer membrane protein assembly factor BamB
VGNLYDLVCVDTVARRILWEKDTDASVGAAPAIWQDRVLFNTFSGSEWSVYCVDAGTGDTIWRVPELGSGGTSSGIVSDGVYYYKHAAYTMVARRISDGSVIWQRPNNVPYSGDIAMDEEGRILAPTQRSTLLALRSTDGATLYEIPLGLWSDFGAHIEDGKAYLDVQDEVVCMNTRTGQILWRQPEPYTDVFGIAIPDSSTNQIRAHQSWHFVYGIDRTTGAVLWTVDLPASLLIINPPVDAAGTSYHVWTGSVNNVFAVTIDGRHLWTGSLGENGNGSSIIGPDGTLYVVSGNRTLFAFRDPHVSAILTDFSIPQGARASGGLLSLSASDDSYFEMNSQAWFLLSEANLSTLELGAHTTKQNPKMMDIKVEARINQPVGQIKLALKNWLTGAWETVEVQETRSNEDITYWKTGLDCRKYVRPDGRIELQIKTVVNSPITEATFRTYLDQVDIQIRDI